MTSINRRRNGNLEKLKNMPEITLVTERETEFSLPNLCSLPIHYPEGKPARNISMTIWHVRAWIAKPSSLSIITGRC